MGLAFDTISQFPIRAKSPFQNLVDQGVVTSHMFGFKLGRSDSELFLGGFNPTYKKDDFTWLNVSGGVC
jgi:hypothetical protein